MKKLPYVIVSLAVGLALTGVLAGCSGGGKANVQAQIQALKTGDDNARQDALAALAAVGPKAAPAVPVILETIKATKDPVVRRLCAYALGEIGAPAATPAIPVLKEMVKGFDRDLSTTAYNALWAIDPKSADPNYKPINVQ